MCFFHEQFLNGADIMFSQIVTHNLTLHDCVRDVSVINLSELDVVTALDMPILWVPIGHPTTGFLHNKFGYSCVEMEMLHN